MVNGPIAREAYYFFKKILIFYWLLCLFLSIPIFRSWKPLHNGPTALFIGR